MKYKRGDNATQRILCNHDHYFVNWKHTVLKLFVNCFKKKNRISCKFLVIYFRLFHKMNTLCYQSHRGYYSNRWAATEVTEILFETSAWWWCVCLGRVIHSQLVMCGGGIDV